MTAQARWAVRVLGAAATIVAAAWLLADPAGRLLATPTIGSFDKDVAVALHAHATAIAIGSMSVVSHVHGTIGILSMSALLAAWLSWKGMRPALPLLAAAVPGGLLLNVAVKHAIHRARPETLYAAERLATFSFPSGHTTGATVFYGFLVALLWSRFHAPAARAALLAMAAGMLALVAASRVMLGVHYPSDCVAAMTEGLLWLAVCLVGRRAGLAAGARFAG